MLTVISCMVIGILTGYALRKRHIAGLVGKMISVAIVGLLFFLGISVGTNKDIMNNLSTIGVNAMLISFAATMGSVLVSWLVYTIWFKNKES
ncbi:MAG: LysO family transporter [Tannerellaceae bacterium]